MRVSDKKTIADRPPGGKGVRPWLPLAALFATAAALRAWTVIDLSRDLRINEPVLDGLYYLELARRLAEGQGWPPGPIFMTPFYPSVLSVLFRTGLTSILSVQILQSVLGLAALGLLFVVVRRDLGERAAWATAVLSLLCGPILAMESQVLTESLLLLLSTAAIWVWPLPGRRAVVHLLFGIVCGLLVMGRGVFLLLPVAAAVSLGIRARRGSISRRSGGSGAIPGERPARGRRSAAGTGSLRAAVAPIAAVSAGLLLALVPLAVRQTRTTGELRFVTVNGGLNLYLGNNPWARGLYSLPPGIDLEQDLTAARSASLAAGRELTLSESDRFYMQNAVRFLTEQPGRALWLLGRKLLLYFSPHEIPQIEVFSLFRRDVAPLRIAFVDFRWILPLAVLGLVAELNRRRRGGEGPRTSGGASAPEPSSAGLPNPARAGARNRRLEPYLILVGIGWISTVLFFATGRYRVPFLPGFLGLAGLGAAVLVTRWRPGEMGFAVAALPLTVVLQLLVPSYPRAQAEAFDAYQLGVRLARAGRAEEALAAYQRSAALAPEEGESWHGVGAALVGLGRLREAAHAYQRALERIPGSAITHYNLGVVRGRLGDDAGAVRELEEAVRLDPYDPAFRSDLAVAYARTNRREDAIRELRRVLRRDPHHAPARRALEVLGASP